MAIFHIANDRIIFKFNKETNSKLTYDIIIIAFILAKVVMNTFSIIESSGYKGD